MPSLGAALDPDQLIGDFLLLGRQSSIELLRCRFDSLAETSDVERWR